MTDLLRYPWMRYTLLPFLGGLLYASAFPFAKDMTFPLGGLLGMGLLLNNFSYFSQDTQKSLKIFKNEIISVLLFSLGYYLLGYYWISYTISEFGRIGFPFNHLLGLFFSLVIIPHFLIFCFFNQFLRKMALSSHSFISGLSRRNITYALLFTLLEYYVPQQFPAHLGHTWLAFAPYIGLTPYLGAPVFSFFSYLLILVILQGIRVRKWDYLGLGSFVLFVLINLSIPLKKIPEPTGETLNLRMVQANIGNFLKLSSEGGSAQALNEVLDIYRKLSLAPSDIGEIDLIVWPETAYPRLLSSRIMRDTTLFTPALLLETVQSTGADLFFGGYDQASMQNQSQQFFETEYNAALLLRPSGKIQDVYHKRVLIPFGESLPFGPLNSTLSQYITNISFFAKGDLYPLFLTSKKTPFITAICYEILFSSFVRDYLNHLDHNPLFLINLTNDSWYGDTSEPYQHLFLAKWRSLEFNLPIFRMTNTGISSVIYPDGSESDRLQIFEQGSLDVAVELSYREPTWFQRWGILGTLVLGLVMMALSFMMEKIFSKEKIPL